MISLFWQSISPTSVILFLCARLNLLFSSHNYLHKLISTKLNTILGSGIYFYFTSGRGALSFAIKQVCNKGDEVILSSYTCIAVPSAIINAGLKPVYVDIDIHTLMPDYNEIKSKINNRTKVLIIQHTLGNFALSPQIQSLCHSNDILIIEDCSLSIGSSYKSNQYGSFADMAIYSLELSKTLSTGWGGILRVNSRELSSKFVSSYADVKTQNLLASICDLIQTVVCSFHYKYTSNIIIFSYFISLLIRFNIFRLSAYPLELHGTFPSTFVQKINSPQLLLLLHQLSLAQSIFSKVNNHFTVISQALLSAGFYVHIPYPNSFTQFTVSNRVSFLVDNKESIIKHFESRQIPIGVWFTPPLSPLPLSDIYNYNQQDFPKSKYLSDHVLNLPAHSNLSPQQVSHIINTIHSL